MWEKPMLLAVVLALSLTPQVAVACADDRSAQVMRAAQPDFPDGKTLHGQRVSLVKVSVSATGHVSGTSVYKSSGDAALDHAAIVAAMASTYQPAIKDCKAVTGSYLFRVEFS